MNGRVYPEIIVALAGILLTGCRKGSMEDNEAAPDTRTMVNVTKLCPSCEFLETASLQGTLRTKYSAEVCARVGGTLDTVDAEEGRRVKAGQQLFQVDKVNLENRVRMARDDREVAKAALKEAEALRVQVLAQVEKARTDEQRMKMLFEKDKAVTKDAWERADLQAKTTDAARARADAAVETARVKIVQADTALAVAEKMLADSRGVAPFDGVITEKMKDTGDFIAVGKPIFAMNDPRLYEVCFTMNAADYGRVEEGKTMVELTAPSAGFTNTQGKAGSRLFPVSYKSPSVHPVTRTFEIRIVVPISPELAPGMILNGRVVFTHRKGPGVPSPAVGLRNGERVVFIVTNGKVESVTVRTGLAWNGMIEIINPSEALSGADIVSEGMLLLNPGDEVRTTSK